MTPEQQLQALRDARAEADRQRKLVLDEMNEKGRQGRLWTNGQCKAWGDYEAAMQKLEEERNTAGT